MTSSIFRRPPGGLRFWILIVLLLPFRSPAAGRAHAWDVEDIKQDALHRPADLFTRDYAVSVAGDAKAILASPGHWDRRDWLLAGGLTSLVAASSALDDQIRVESQENRTRSLNAAARNVQRFGAEGSFVVIGLLEGYGWLAKDARARAVAMDSLTASIIAAGLVTPALKWSIGRVRPNHASRVFEFRPFSGNQSFPSGHSTQAFAVASVIAAHYDQWWVKGLSYGVAGLVGYSRIEQNAHFASDVVAGAIIGTIVGRAVVHRHAPAMARPSAFVVSPYFDRGVSGLAFAKSF